MPRTVIYHPVMWMRAGVAFLLVAAVAAPSLAAEETVGRVTGDQVRVRAGPATLHPVLLEVNRGDLLVVVGRESQWCRVLVPGGFVCYVHSSLVKVEDGADPVIAGSRVRLRVTAGKEILPLETVLESGESVEILAKEGEWLKIIPPARTHLYVFEDFVEELGPAREYRKALEERAAVRRRSLVAEKTDEQLANEERARQDGFKDDVVEMGQAVLVGEGDADALRARLRTIAMETTDELTRGYAESLLLLLSLRHEAEELRRELDRLDSAREDEVAALKARVQAADARYAGELEKMREQRELSSRAFRRVGRVTRQDEAIVLILDDGKVVHLSSDRFRLTEYLGKRVSVVGRMVLTDPRTGATHLKVEKLEILPANPGGR